MCLRYICLIWASYLQSRVGQILFISCERRSPRLPFGMSSTIPVDPSLHHSREKVRELLREVSGFQLTSVQLRDPDSTHERASVRLRLDFLKNNAILFQRRRCIQLHIHPGRQRHLSDIGAEHRGRGHRSRRRLCSRRLLGQMVLLFLCSSLKKRRINSLFPLSSTPQWRATSPPPFPPANMRQSLHRIGPNLALELHLPALLDPFLPLLSPTPKKTELFCQWTNEEKTPLPQRQLWRSCDRTWKVKKEGWP